MSKHTEGPWLQRGTAGHDRHGQSVVYNEAGRDVAIVYDGDADAQLIAAAPDMLDTLRAIASDCEQYLNDDLELSGGDLCIAFLKAINEVHDKATGSTFASEEPVDEYGEAVSP